MGYKVIWHEQAMKDLSRMDKPIARRIVNKVESHLKKDPLELGKALKGKFTGMHRYRIGDYRVIYAIRDQQVEILILHIDHRKQVYR